MTSSAVAATELPGAAEAAGLFKGLYDAEPTPARSSAKTLGRATARCGVNVRSTPSGDGSILGTLAQGEQLDVSFAAGSWLGVLYQGRPAYITGRAKYVDHQAARPAVAAPATRPTGSLGGVADSVTLNGRSETRDDEETEAHLDDEANGEAGKANKPAYFSQRDNAFSGDIKGKKVSADSACNVTSLAMQLVTLAGGKTEPVNRRTIQLLREHGETRTDEELVKMQVEDLILELFGLRGNDYWKNISASNRPPFYKGWYEAWMNNADKGWHQIATCLNFTAGQYTDLVAHTSHYEGADAATPEYFKGTLRPALAQGSTIMLSTKLTGGHIVALTGVEDDGVRINDPYGMRLPSGYVKNGTAASAATLQKNHDAVALRLKHNPALQALVADAAHIAAQKPGNWGENNFYPWDEVQTYQIGKWNNILEKKKK